MTPGNGLPVRVATLAGEPRIEWLNDLTVCIMRFIFGFRRLSDLSFLVGERTKRRIEELEEQLSMCLNSEMFRMPSGASIGPQDQHSSFPVSKSTTNVDPHYRFPELDAWAENSILNSNQPHQTPQSDAKSFRGSIGECSTRSVPTSGTTSFWPLRYTRLTNHSLQKVLLWNSSIEAFPRSRCVNRHINPM